VNEIKKQAIFRMSRASNYYAVKLWNHRHCQWCETVAVHVCMWLGMRKDCEVLIYINVEQALAGRLPVSAAVQHIVSC